MSSTRGAAQHPGSKPSRGHKIYGDLDVDDWIMHPDIMRGTAAYRVSDPDEPVEMIVDDAHPRSQSSRRARLTARLGQEEQ